jgi:hypothetical protein
MISEAEQITISAVEAADRAANGRALSLTACTALEASLHESVGRIIDEREEAVTDAMKFDRVPRWLRWILRLG